MAEMENCRWGLFWIERWEEVSLGEGGVQRQVDEGEAGVRRAGQGRFRQRTGGNEVPKAGKMPPEKLKEAGWGRGEEGAREAVGRGRTEQVQSQMPETGVCTPVLA